MKDRNGKLSTEKNRVSERWKQQYFEVILSERNERSAELTMASKVWLSSRVASLYQCTRKKVTYRIVRRIEV